VVSAEEKLWKGTLREEGITVVVAVSLRGQAQRGKGAEA
jgi:hypothetical protein